MPKYSASRLRESNPDTVTHPSTNRAQRVLTSLIGTNDATTPPRQILVVGGSGIIVLIGSGGSVQRYEQLE